MTKITIKLAPQELVVELYGAKNKRMMAYAYMDRYKIMDSFETDLVGDAAAEEAFDLTNNPSRQEEREIRYGRFKSVSVGDIVMVDDVDYLCDSFGWVEI